MVVGTMTTRSLMQASMNSHSSTWLFSIRMRRSPRRRPCAESQFATRLEAAESSAKVRSVLRPSSSAMISAGTSARAGSWARRSNQSKPKLKCSKRGHSNSARARS